MCGFTGFYAWHFSADKQSEVIVKMTNTIKHRGPDSMGFWSDKKFGLGLGHRRLAILDTSPAGSQPMISLSGRYILVFNGEIYNHLDLRGELLAISDPRLTQSNLGWRGNSDTETLLACFDVFGLEDTVKKCNGMFAFALWDKETATLHLVRDRLGEKPIYYGWQGEGSQSAFLFGSELKALRSHPAFVGDIDRHALGGFMQNMVVVGTQSIYKGIFRLPPGSILSLRPNSSNPVIKSYWSVEQVLKHSLENRFSGTAIQAVDKLEALLKDAISRQMLADVPLGAFLSGGVDSSIIVALMQSLSKKPIKTFSIGFHEKAYNEAEHAKAVSNYLGTEHTDLYVSPNQAMQVIPKLPILFDEPFADSSQIPTFLLSQMTGNHVKVALSGDGGDELFSGYNRYQMTETLWPKLEVLPIFLRQMMAYGLTCFSPNTLDRFAKNTPLVNQWASVGDKLHKGAGIMGVASVEELYKGMMATGWPQSRDVVRGLHEETTSLRLPNLPGFTDVERMMAFDLINYLPDDILTKVDRAAMGVSLEARIPFLDHRVVEFAWRLPMEYKLRHENGSLITKWALRQVLYRYVPQALIERPKVGFGVPLEHWLRGPLRDWAENLLSEDRIKSDGFLNTTPIRKRWHEHLSGRRNWHHSIWCVLMFNSWLDEQKRSLVSQ